MEASMIYLLILMVVYSPFYIPLLIDKYNWEVNREEREAKEKKEKELERLKKLEAEKLERLKRLEEEKLNKLKEERKTKICEICSLSLTNDYSGVFKDNKYDLICQKCKNEQNLQQERKTKSCEICSKSLINDITNNASYYSYSLNSNKYDLTCQDCKTKQEELRKLNEIEREKKFLEKQERKNFPICCYCNKKLPISDFYFIDTRDNVSFLHNYVEKNDEKYRPPCKSCKNKYRDKTHNSSNNNNSTIERKEKTNNNYFVYYIKLLNPYNKNNQFKIGITQSINDDINQSLNKRYEGSLDRIELVAFKLFNTKLEAEKLEALIINENLNSILKNAKLRNLSTVSPQEIFEVDIINNNNKTYNLIYI